MTDVLFGLRVVISIVTRTAPFPVLVRKAVPMSLPVRALPVAAASAVAAMAIAGLALPTSSATVLPTANTSVLASHGHHHDGDWDDDHSRRDHNRIDHNRYDHNDSGDDGLIVLHDIL